MLFLVTEQTLPTSSSAILIPIEVNSLTQTTTVASGPTASPDAPNSMFPSGNADSKNLAVMVAAIVTVILLLGLATVVTAGLILCLWRKRRRINQRSRPSSLPRRKSKSGFFDNPVYDHLQRKLSKDSQGYASIYDHVYLEVPEEKDLERARYTKHGDGDSGYAEPEVKITAPSLKPGEYSELTASPSPCSSPYPRRSPSPCPSHASATMPIKFSNYHTLDSCPVAEEYLQPCPNSLVSGTSDDFLRKATCSQDDNKTSSCEKIPHEYHELEPTTGVRYGNMHEIIEFRVRNM